MCKKKVEMDICKNIPIEVRLDPLLHFSVFADSENRICVYHLHGNRIDSSVAWDAHEDPSKTSLPGF